jgi:hypothetical protein
MAEERIDVVVTDKVDDSVAKKFDAIAASADRTQTSLDKLKAALANINVSAVERLAAAMAKTDSAQARLISAQARLTNAQNAGSVAAQRAALAQAKLATEAARTEAAQARAAAASAGAEGAQLRLATAQAKVTASANAAAASQDRMANSTRNAGNAAGTSEQIMQRYAGGMRFAANAGEQYSRAGRQVNAANANIIAQIQDIVVSLAGGQNPLLVAVQQGSQLSYIATTLTGGYSALLAIVFGYVGGQKQATTATTQAAAANLAAAQSAAVAAAAQAQQTAIAAQAVVAEQGLVAARAQAAGAANRLAVAQVQLAGAQAAVTASATPSAAAIQALALAENRLTAASGAATIAQAELAAANSAVAASSEAAAAAQLQLANASAGTRFALGPLGAIVVGLALPLGAAAAALVQFKNELNDNSGLNDYVNTLGLTTDELKELENQTITYGDMATGTWMTIKEGLAGLAPVFDAIGVVIMGVIDLVWATLKNFSFGVTALFKGTFSAVMIIWNQFPAAFTDLFVQAANGAIGLLEGIANASVGVLNMLGANFERVTLTRMVNSNAGAASKMGGDLAGAYTGAFRDAEAGYNRFVDRVGQNTNTAARNRLGAAAGEIISDRSPGSKKTGGASEIDKEARAAERRAAALQMVNEKLDNEIARMKLLKDERAVQQRMDQIEESLLQKKITLDKTEREGILAKVRAAEAFKLVQSEMDRIYDEVNGPAQTYANTLKAITELEKQKALTSQQVAQEQAKAARILALATDPLLQMSEALTQQESTLGLYGRALQQANYYEEIRQTLLKEGTVLSTTYVAGVNAEVDALMRRNAALQQGQFIQQQASQFIDPAMEQNMFIQNYQLIYDEIQRMRQTDLGNEAAYQQALYGLQARYNEMRLSGASSFFGELANVTKNGTGVIGGISKAAAIAQATIDGYVAVQKALASLPPPFNFAAAAAVAVKTGIQVAGIVSTNAGSFATGGQFMVDGKSGIDANNINMNVTRGERVTVETPAQQRANDNAAGGPNISFNPKIVNVTDPKEALAAMDTSEGEQLIINVIERNASVIQNIMGTR